MDKKLIKEFPFLEGLEKEFGELGHVRIQRASRDEVKAVRDLPTQSKNTINCVREIPSSNEDEGLLFYRAELKLTRPLKPLVISIIYKYKKEDNKMSNTINLFGNEVDVKEVSIILKGSNIILGYLVYGIIEPDSPDTFITHDDINNRTYTILDKIERDEFALFIDVDLYLDENHLGTYTITAYPGQKPKVNLKGEQTKYFVYEIERDENNYATSLKLLKGFNETLTPDNGFYIASEPIGLVSNSNESDKQELPDYIKFTEDDSDSFIMAFKEPLNNDTMMSYAKGELKLESIS